MQVYKRVCSHEWWLKIVMQKDKTRIPNSRIEWLKFIKLRLKEKLNSWFPSLPEPDVSLFTLSSLPPTFSSLMKKSWSGHWITDPGVDLNRGGFVIEPGSRDQPVIFIIIISQMREVAPGRGERDRDLPYSSSIRMPFKKRAFFDWKLEREYFEVLEINDSTLAINCISLFEFAVIKWTAINKPGLGSQLRAATSKSVSMMRGCGVIFWAENDIRWQ